MSWLFSMIFTLTNCHSLTTENDMLNYFHSTCHMSVINAHHVLDSNEPWEQSISLNLSQTASILKHWVLNIVWSLQNTLFSSVCTEIPQVTMKHNQWKYLIPLPIKFHKNQIAWYHVNKRMLSGGPDSKKYIVNMLSTPRYVVVNYVIQYTHSIHFIHSAKDGMNKDGILFYIW